MSGRDWAAIGLKWAARVGSVISIGLLSMFLFSEFGRPTAKEWVMLACFPFGVIAGMALGWWRELLGGVVALAALGAFYLVCFALGGSIPGGPYFFLFASPAVLFVAAGMMKMRQAPRAALV